MSGYGTAKEHMDWAVGRALEYYNRGDHTHAIASFISDMNKHDATAHIAQNPMTLMILQGGAREPAEVREGYARFHVLASSR
jgi:hypothetical protein